MMEAKPPEPQFRFHVRAILSFAGHLVSIVSNSSMAVTPKQQIEKSLECRPETTHKLYIDKNFHTPPEEYNIYSCST